MKFKSVYSEQKNADFAVNEIKEQLNDIDTKLLLYFSTSNHSPWELSKAMNSAFPDVETFGCTTAGEITTGRMLEQSVVAMAFSDEAVADVHITLMENISSDPNAIPNGLRRLEQSLNRSVSDLDYREYVGLLMIDGMSGSEERVIEKIGDYTNIMVVGGSAGDDLKFEHTHVFHNGIEAINAAVLCIMRPKVKFDVLKTQSFDPSDISLVVTKTNEEKREVVEFNHQPASKAYAEALNTTVEDLPNKAFRYPLGMMVSKDEPFVRSPRVVDNGSVLFYCSVKEGMELNVLSPTDIIEDTRKAIEDKKQELGNISAIINFHCILRTLDLKQQEKTAAYGELFKDVPTIGFSTYGECYLGHINQTSTMLIFK
jgi:hypothetical protein